MLAWLIVIAIAIGGVLLFTEMNFRLTEHYSPKLEAVRRTTYEESRAFQEGTVRDFENLYLEYSRSNDAGKAAIRDVARHRIADVPDELMTGNLRRFKSELESN